MSIPKRILFAFCLSLASLGSSALAADPGIPADEGEAPEEPAQLVRFYSGLDPQTRRITLSLATADGKSLMMIVDKATDTVYLSDGTGSTAEIGIPALAQAYSQGDPAKYAAFMASMQRNLNSNVAMDLIAKTGNIAFAPPNGIVHPCDMQPCYALQPQFVDYRLDSMFRWSPEGVDYSYENWYTADEIAEDRDDFDRWQADQCATAGSEFREALLGYLGALFSCPTAETGIGLGLCTVTIGSGINDHNDSLEADRNCRMPYPGPGRWGR